MTDGALAFETMCFCFASCEVFGGGLARLAAGATDASSENTPNAAADLRFPRLVGKESALGTKLG